MTSLRRHLTTALLASTAVVGTTVATAAPARADTYSAPLTTAVRALPVAVENGAGYDRSLFTHWIDADGDCQDTRSEVLRAEVKTAVGGACTVTSGSWYSYYDGVTITDPSLADVDHLIPLGEAWPSGARTWTADTRKRFANDLGDPRALVAVTQNANRGKGDQDPGEWQPLKERCRYIAEWTAMKHRWSLTVDTTERNALILAADNCPAATITVTKAAVYHQSTTPTCSTAGIRVDLIQYKATSLTGEYVRLRNPGTAAVNITDWSVADAAGRRYVFPARNLAAGAAVRIRTGSGTNTSTDVYWGSGSYIWNDSSDSFTLRNCAGTVKQTGSYTGTSTGYKVF